MTKTGVKLMPVSDLLDKEFFIRSYQRGYRWDQEQVRDLLNDFIEFIEQENKHEEEFYCLQPIVVKSINEAEKKYLQENAKFNFENDSIYEVIDGQQRITTITILLHYKLHQLKNEITLKSFPIITYEVRPESKEILQNFIKSVHSEEEKLNNKIDFFHMKSVYEAIDFWFSEFVDSKNEKLWQVLKLLTAYKINNVKVIWYEVDDDEKSVEVFRRFNIGKIPLSNSELIKALFLRNDERNNNAMIYSISKEWQNIENQFRDPIFWSFINPTEDYSSRIELLFEIIFQIAKYEAKEKAEAEKVFEKKYGTDKSNVFRYFFTLINKLDADLQEIWDGCVEKYERINQWFKDPYHFHYIGYLQNRESRKKEENIIIDLFINQKKFKKKEDLTEYLVTKIKDTCKIGKFFNNQDVSLVYDTGNTRNLRDFFFLFNVEICCNIANSGEGEEVYRLPFNLHKATAFDIEHIDSKTEKDIETLNDTESIEFIKDIVTDFEEEVSTVFESNKGILFVNQNSNEESLWSEDNIQLKNLKLVLHTIVDVLDERLSNESNQIVNKDLIGNITALNSTINRSYGNAYYNTKRRCIIYEDLVGTYIPIATKNIFLKYYSKNVKKHTRWSSSDAEDYTKVMQTTLNKFM